MCSGPAVPAVQSGSNGKETRPERRNPAVPSSTVLDGRYCIRVAITNHRTRRPDIDRLVDEVLRLGAEMASAAGGRKER